MEVKQNLWRCGLVATLLGALSITPGVSGAFAATGQAKASSHPSSSTHPIVILSVGDIMLVQRMAMLVQSRGANYPFERVRPLFASADVVIGNLEAPFTYRKIPTRSKSPASVRAGRDFILKAAPQSASGLAFAGFHAVSLANNHAMDYGAAGLRETISILDRLGIRHAGAGMTGEAARRPARLTRKGLRITLLSYSDVLPLNWAATADRPGVAPAKGPGAREQMRRGIIAARRDSDFVIVAIHWGEQLAKRPDPTQRELGRLLVDWGADAVLGHHPHVLQGIEVRRGKVIAYSLGNFVSLSRTAEQRETIILRLDVGAPHQISAARAIPVQIRTGQPVALDILSGRGIINRVRSLSLAFGTAIRGDGQILLTPRSGGVP